MGLAAAASRTTNPILLALILAVAGFVVATRRSAAPWANAFRGYLVLGLVVTGIRMAFRALLGGGSGDTVLFTIPRLPLPEWLTGLTIGGPVTAEALAASLYDGMRLATILVCVGAANTLADPRRLLRSLPRSLYETGSAAAVALSLAPQLVESIGRVRRARRLRGHSGKGIRSVRSLLMPVLGDALDRSLALAAAMDSRGYGRARGPRSPLPTALALAAVGLITLGLLGLLGRAIPAAGGLAAVALGLAVGAAAMAVTGRSVGRTWYRRDRWGFEGWLIAGAGVVAAAAVWAVGAAAPTAVNPPVSPMAWPALPPMAAVGIVAATLPAWLAPPAEAAPAARALERAA